MQHFPVLFGAEASGLIHAEEGFDDSLNVGPNVRRIHPSPKR